MKRWLPVVLLVELSFDIVCSGTVLAQITPDNTLGEEQSRIVQGRSVRGRSAASIEGGAVRGSNLFHSFREFNVAEGQRVYFANPSGVDNIVSRVTGGTSSSILGTLGVDGGANLFLINPSGIIFGPNARLDVSGSFTATASQGVTFADGSIFSIATSDPSTLLTVSAPVGIQYGSNASSNILVQGVLNSGGNLSLQADGTIEINRNGRLVTQTNNSADAGHIDLWAGTLIAVDGSDIIKVNPNGTQRVEPNIYSRSESNGQAGSITFVAPSVQLRNYAQVFTGTTGSGQGGQIRIEADSLDLSSGSRLDAVTSGSGRGGDIRIEATRSAAINNGVVRASTTGTGDSGNITIQTGNSFLFSGHEGLIINDLSGAGATGDAGDITIQARNQITLGPSEASGHTNPDDATIATYSLRQYNAEGNIISNSLLPTGAGGNITLQAETIEILNGAGISSDNYGLGQGGNITLQANTVEIRGERARIVTSTLGPSQGGTVYINADRLMQISGGGSRIEANTRSSGQSGNINIRSNDSIATLDGARIEINTSGSGLAGNVLLLAENQIVVDGSGTVVASIVGIPLDDDGVPIPNAAPEGNAGRVLLRANRVEIRDDAQITVSTEGIGRGGDIQINADSIQLNRGRLNANTELGSSGDGGNIRLSARRLVELINSNLNASTRGTGNAGNISIRSRGSARFSRTVDGPVINTATSYLGNAGQIDIQARRSLLMNGIRISSGSFLRDSLGGRGGNVVLRAGQIDIRSDSQIVADTQSASPGGNITIQADFVRLSDSSLNVNTRGTGTGGTIQIEADRAIEIEQSRLNSNTVGAGDSGNITLRSRGDVEIRSNSDPGYLLINTSTYGSGDAGTIEIQAESHLRINGENATILSNSGMRDRENSTSLIPAGDGGEVIITANEISIQNGTAVRAGVQGSGRGGSVTVQAQDNVLLNGDARVDAATSGTGSGGTIAIRAGENIEIDDGEVSVRSFETGNAGQINLSADSIVMDYGGRLDARAAESQGGNIGLDTANLVILRRSSFISAESSGPDSRDGNIAISANFLVTVPSDNSDIIARSTNGGNIDLEEVREGYVGFQVQPDFALTSESDITGTGAVLLNPDVTDPSRGLTELATDVVDAANQVTQVCPTGNAASRTPSEFIVTGRGGLPANPEDALDGETLLADWVTLDESDNPVAVESEPVSEPATEAPLVEAQGWRRGSNGEVVFTAQAAVSASSSQTIPHCP